MSPIRSRLRSSGTTVSWRGKLPPDGRIQLGAFRDKVTGSNLSGTWESWELGPLYNAQSYQPTDFRSSIAIIRDELHPGPPYRVGGDMKSFKAALVTDLSAGVLGKGVYRNVYDTRRYEGGFMPPTINSLFDVSWDRLSTYYQDSLKTDLHLFPDIDDWGAKGWKRTKPKIESAGAYVFLREAKDIPRMIATTRNLARDFHDTWEGIAGKLNQARSYVGGKQLYRTNVRGWKQAPKRASDQFLNQQFGSPFINDILSFDKVYQNGRQYIQRLVDRNGRFIRRGVHPLADWNDVSVVSSGSYPGSPIDGYSLTTPGTHGVGLFPVTFPGDFFVAPPTYSITDEVHNRVDAVGRFQFYNPIFNVSYVKDGTSAWDTVRRYLAIYGLRITPSNVYKAIPWTWLIDWFVDVSRYVDAISDALVDQVVCDYYYVTVRQEYKRVFTTTLPFIDGTVNLSYSITLNSKERMGATSPFDFSLGWGDLSPRQLAILAALRISRV